MNQEQIQKLLQKVAEDEILPESIHLWPGVKNSLVAKMQSHSKQGENKMLKQTKHNPGFAWLVIISVIFLGLGILFFTPQGKAFAQQIANFFTRGDENEQVVPSMEASLEPQSDDLVATPALGSVTLDGGCGSAISPQCSLEEVQKETAFNIQTFANLPEGMSFSGATTIEQGVLLLYQGDYGALGLIESPVDSDQSDTWTVGKDASVKSTTVRQYPAEYVQGSWQGFGRSDDVMVWDESIPTRTLRWEADDIAFTLIHYPAQGIDAPIGYEMDQLTTLAGDICAESDSSLADVPDNGIALEEAESKAGFDFRETNQIPAGLSLYQTTYNSQRNAICQYYRGYKDNPDMPTLVIVQSTWALPTLDEIQTKAYYGDMRVEIGISQETLPITGADGGEGSFIETGLQIDALCGGESSTTHRVLLWQQQNRTFAVFAHLDAHEGASFVSKIEMQRIAESLNGAAIDIDLTGLDPERLLSLNDAEALTGWDILQPAVMLSAYHFNHINVGTSMGSAYQAVTEYRSSTRLSNGFSRVQVYQIPETTMTLEDYKMGGGYLDTTVKENPAIYQTQCSDSVPFGTYCFQAIIWFEGNTEYNIFINSTSMVPVETLIDMANSMR